MDSMLVRGGNKISGEIRISGAKNSVLPILAATILTPETVKLSNVPNLVDTLTMINLIESLGAKVEKNSDSSLEIFSGDINNYFAPYDIVRKMRASIWVLGPLLARFGKAKVSMPGGCAIGARMIDQHIAVMESLGAQISNEDGYLVAKVNGKLKGTKFNFSKVTVGGTINAILAATLADGMTYLTNCAYEPEIADLCMLLVKMGAKISGIGTSTIEIEGVNSLKGSNHEILGDRIEAGTFMMLTGLVGGKVTLTGIDHNIIENTILKLREVGLKINVISGNSIIVESSDIIKPIDIETEPYPGFATDLQAQYMALMTKCDGRSVITENIFENRFMHVPELCRMGAKISIKGHSAFVTGVNYMTGAEVMASDLRASSSLIMAGLVSKGETKVRRIYHLDRGFEKLEDKLQKCGLDIERIHGDSA